MLICIEFMKLQKLLTTCTYIHTTPAPMNSASTYQEVAKENRHDHHKGDEEEVGHGGVDQICFIEDGLKIKLPGRLHDRLDESTGRGEEGTQHSRSIVSLREAGVGGKWRGEGGGRRGRKQREGGNRGEGGGEERGREVRREGGSEKRGGKQKG